jgi:hypothetical protein
MQRDEVRNLVEALDEEIRENSQLSAHDREMLAGVRRDLAAALAHPDPPKIEHHRIAGNLRTAAERMEATHPDLTALMVRVMDSLVKMGV